MPTDIGHRVWSLALIQGIIAIALGIIAMTYTGATLHVLAIILGIFWIVDGAVTLSTGLKTLKDGGGLSIFLGILGFMAGIVTLRAPGVAAAALAILIAFWMLVAGFARGYGAFVMATSGARGTGWGWLLASAVLNVALGVFLLAQPLAGAVIFTWSIGFWAVLEGITIVIFAITLRSQARKLDA